jgi:hypothetical protein
MKWLMAVAVLTGVIAGYVAWTRANRSAFIDRFAFPEGRRRKCREARPELTRAQEELVIDALREWFHVCRLARHHFVSMPSQVMDDDGRVSSAYHRTRAIAGV